MIKKKFLNKVLRPIINKIISREFILERMRTIKLQNKLVVLMYHEIADDSVEIDAWTVVKESDFIRQMVYLSRHFRVVSLKYALDCMNKNSDETVAQKPMAVITFDDGYRGNRQVLLPIIESLNLPVSIFIPTGAIKNQRLYWYDSLINGLRGEKIIILDLNYLSLGKYRINKDKGSENWREIERLLSDLKTLEPDSREKVVEDILSDLDRSQDDHSFNLAPLSIIELLELADSPLVTIGAHSHCHNLLNQISCDAIDISVSTSKQLIESWINRPVYYFAYPNGNFNDQVVDIIKKTGFKCGLTTISKPWSHNDSLFTVPRIGIGRYDSFDLFKIKVAGGLTNLRSFLHLRAMRNP